VPRGVPTLISILLVVLGGGALAWWVGHAYVPPEAAATTVGRPIPAEGWGSFKAMTANLRLDEPSDGDNGWTHRRELAVKIFLKHEPDVLACQELLPSQQAYLNKELSQWYDYYPRAGVGTSTSAPASRGVAAEVLGAINSTFASLNTLYYRTDRFDILDGEAGLVVPEEPQASLKENAFFSLAVLQQKAAPGKKAPTLIVVNVHLRHGDQFAAQCAMRLREKMAKWEEKYPESGEILLGDMNHMLDSEPYAAIVGKNSATGPASAPAYKLVDTFDYSKRPAPPETIGTYHNFTGHSDRPLPSDLIFIGGDLVDVAPAQILRDHAGTGNSAGEWPSDHFFVMAELAFKKQNP